MGTGSKTVEADAVGNAAVSVAMGSSLPLAHHQIDEPVGNVDLLANLLAPDVVLHVGLGERG